MADTGRCPDCDRFTSGDCGKHGPRVEIFTVGPVCIVPCPGCGYAGSGAHVCPNPTSPVSWPDLAAALQRAQADLAEREAVIARLERVRKAAAAVLAEGCECPVQEPGMHRQTCEGLRAALADAQEP